MKSKSTAIILALFLGGFGIHKIYLEKYGTGILYLVFCWTGIPILLSLIDIVLLLSTSKEDFNLLYNYDY